MNTGRIIGGGLAGGVVFTIVSILVNDVVLSDRYAALQSAGVLRTEARLPFIPIYIVVLFLISIGLAWLYAVARAGLGPGPGTALTVGLVVGLIGSVPAALAQFSWTYQGGFVSLAHLVERVAGCMLATLVAGWLYRE